MAQRRNLTLADRFVAGLDQGLRAMFASAPATRQNPAARLEPPTLSPEHTRAAIGLMRVNHSGEVAAQALYQGQALTARRPALSQSLDQAAQEEADHLAWCEDRLQELGGRTSLLNPVWYAGSFSLGALAGLLGDRWNLGFLAETERQVVVHLERHLQLLPAADSRSRAIVEQMRLDEAAHAESATSEGGAELPRPVRRLMSAASKIMTRTSFWV